MTAFSRGLYCCLRQPAFRSAPSIRATISATRSEVSRCQAYIRPFNSSALRFSEALTRAPARATSSIESLLRTVQTTRASVVLYKAPPRYRVLFRVYSWATLVTGIGLYSWYFLKHLPAQQPFFVAPTYAVIGFAFVAIGIHIFQRPVRRISVLELIPGATGRPQLRMMVHQAPWAKESEFIFETWEATLSEKIHPLVKEIAEANRARKQSITTGLEHMSIIPRCWEIAARWLEQKWTTFFLKFKYAIFQFGIAEVEVENAKWKIDCDGWLLDEGKVIDRLISEA